MTRLMRYKWIALTLFAFSAIAVARDMGQMTKLEKVEPPLEFILEIDGQKFPLSADAPTKITVAGKQVTANLAIKEDRLFSIEGLSFRYPRQHDFAFNADSSRWSLNGDNNKLSIRRVGPDFGAMELGTELAAGIIKQFGHANVKQAKSQVTLGGKEYESTRVTAKILGRTVTHEIIGLTTPNATFLILIQDFPNDDGTTSDETKKVLKLLDKTFKLDN